MNRKLTKEEQDGINAIVSERINRERRGTQHLCARELQPAIDLADKLSYLEMSEALRTLQTRWMKERIKRG